MVVLAIALTIVASISPILTTTWLWQVKEWRWDRLRVHLNHEGWIRQLFGVARPVVTVLGILLVVSMYVAEQTSDVSLPWWFDADASAYYVLCLLSWFTLFRITMRRQATPVWTSKALFLFSLSLFLNAVAVLLVGFVFPVFISDLLLIVVPICACVFVAVSWLLLYPLDRLLKMRVLAEARAHRAQFPHLTVIGITGSVGKTMTKELIAHLLSDRSLLVTPEHVNTELGVAQLLIDELTSKHAVCVLEMGAYCRGEIEAMCSYAQPQIGVITAIGKQHIALFGSQENIVRGKGELFRALPPQGHAFLNIDTGHVESLAIMTSCPVHTVSSHTNATYQPFDVQEHDTGITFTVRSVPFSVPVHGGHHLTNIVLSIAVAESLGVPLPECARRLQSFAGVAKTFEQKVGKKGQIVIDDTYNASPASFRAAIEWARQHPSAKKVLIAAGLLELGDELPAVYKELGTACSDVFAEVIFLNKKCVQYFEEGYGKSVIKMKPEKLRASLEEGMLVVCEGRMPERVVRRLLR